MATPYYKNTGPMNEATQFMHLMVDGETPKFCRDCRWGRPGRGTFFERVWQYAKCARPGGGTKEKSIL